MDWVSEGWDIGWCCGRLGVGCSVWSCGAVDGVMGMGCVSVACFGG